MVLLLAGVGGMAHGLSHGHWLPAAGNAAVIGIAMWGLRLPHRHDTTLPQTPRLTGPADPPGATQIPPPATSTNPAPCPDPTWQEAVFNTTGTAHGQLPAVDSFTLTGHLDTTPTGATAHLSLTLPPAIHASTPAVIDALLTTGHQLLHDHGLTDHPLPEVDMMSVQCTRTPPSTHPDTTFTVHITNDLATGTSSITMNPQQPQTTPHQVLLITATLLAGAEHLLDHPHQRICSSACRNDRNDSLSTLP